MSTTHDPYVLPEGLPEPVDDGAADHLAGLRLPDVVLPSSHGDVSLAEQGIEPERPPYRVREGGSPLCFVRDPDDYRIELSR